MDYIIAVQAPAYPIDAEHFAIESAFGKHLQELRAAIGSEFDRLVLIAPRLTDAAYQAQREHLHEISLQHDRIVFLPAHATDDSAKRFWLSRARPLWSDIRGAVRQASVVHSGMASDIWRPLMAFVNFAGWLEGRAIVFMVDIDFRRNSQRYRQLGIWSLKAYIVNRLFYDPIKWIQVWIAVRFFKLCLLKSVSMVKDFGRGRPNVRFFLDAAHGAADIIATDQLAARLPSVRSPQQALQLVFFGRLVAYKGLDWTIEAVRLARLQNANVQLTIIGDGDVLDALRKQVQDQGLAGVVTFVPAVKYGDPLFALLDKAHVTIATPRVEDTPRAALDAMARGLPLVAFDLEYFVSLAEKSGAVALARWPDPASVAELLVRLDRDRELVAQMSERAVVFASENTQEIWLKRRIEWTKECLSPRGEPAAKHIQTDAAGG